MPPSPLRSARPHAIAVPITGMTCKREERAASRRAIVALAIAALQMVAGLPMMAHGTHAASAIASAAMHPLLRPALLVSTLAVMALARSFFVHAWEALRQRSADASTLVALGSGTALLYSAAATIAPAAFATEARLPDVHFEAASFILAFALLGRAIEGRTCTRTTALVEEAQSSRAPVQRLADRVSAIVVLAIVAAALAAALGGALLGPEPRLVHALTTFVTVVVVSCPCALFLATPIATATAIRRAAQLGIFARSGDALERAAQVDTVVLDTTGTLTAGEPELVQLVLMAHVEPEAREAAADAVLRLAAAVERGSEHPVGRAIIAEAVERGLKMPAPRSFVESAGAGARAGIEGHDVRVGSLAWLAGEGIASTGTRAEAAFGIAVDGELRAYGLVADRLRDEASDALARLRALGIRVIVLTGERQDVAREVAAELGVAEVEAELSPAGKLAALDRLRREGCKVAMCGDGIDDAPALARALVSIAVAGDTGAAIDASDITLLAGGLARLPDTLQLARRSLRVIRQNMGWAVAYNLALVPIAAGALVASFGLRSPPALVAAAMALSSLSVVLSSLRLRHFTPR